MNQRLSYLRSTSHRPNDCRNRYSMQRFTRERNHHDPFFLSHQYPTNFIVITMADYLRQWEVDWREMAGGAASGYDSGDSVALVLADIVYGERFG
ncbi:hypothetical protein MMC27_004373, partial [Xylographa pallens]|nr:hypothetical protein [Xylographa pallens]